MPSRLWPAAIAVGLFGLPCRPAPVAGQPSAQAPATPYGCVVCHADMRRAFVEGVHADRGITCDVCHGGDPTALEVTSAHSGDFLGAPDKLRTIELCGSCHSDRAFMRQFGLPSDQVEAFRTSRHGQLLLEEHNTDAPTCSDCHNAHTILPADDARSSVYSTNIPSMCGRCHADETLMERYGVSNEVVEQYEESAHGVGLIEEQNFAAPSCIGCHGSHSALPPTVTQISNVCGRCHALVRQAFERGPHASASSRGELTGCTECHTNHATQRTSPTAIRGTCVVCHDAGTTAVNLGTDLQERIVHAAADIEAADIAIQQLLLTGQPVTDLRFRYQTARTDYLRLALVQHSLDADELGDLTLRIRSISRDIRGAAEASAEREWEHKLILVPVWFLAFAGILLAGLKLRRLRKSEPNA